MLTVQFSFFRSVSREFDGEWVKFCLRGTCVLQKSCSTEHADFFLHSTIKSANPKYIFCLVLLPPLLIQLYHFSILMRVTGMKVVKSTYTNPANIYLFRVQSHRRRSGVFIVNIEHISHLFLVFLLLTENK